MFHMQEPSLIERVPLPITLKGLAFISDMNLTKGEVKTVV
jgi:hypothetical protein